MKVSPRGIEVTIEGRSRMQLVNIRKQQNHRGTRYVLAPSSSGAVASVAEASNPVMELSISKLELT